MTVLTKPICAKKDSDQKKPLVDVHSTNILIKAEDGNSSFSAQCRRPYTTTVFIFMTAFLLFSSALLGGFYLFREFRNNRHFRTWCSVPFTENNSDRGFKIGQAKGLVYSDGVNQLLKTWSQQGSMTKNLESIKNKFLDEEVDIDLEFEQYERIEVPDFSGGRRGRFIHDFGSNKTGIIDLDESRCFILPLNNTMVLRPKSLLDLIRKMREGYYDIDTEIVRESYRIIFPAVQSLKSMGYYIARECAEMPTYKLEKIVSKVYKRDVSLHNERSEFTEFAGNKISITHIVNLHSAPKANPQ